MNKATPQIISFIKKLDEPKLTILIDNILRLRCGYSEFGHSAEEYGTDILALIEPENDRLNKPVTIMVQVKAKKLRATELKKEIFGQLTEIFTRKLNRDPFSDYNPRRIILAANVTPTQHVLNAIEYWNATIPIPIEFLGLEHLSDLAYDTFQNLENIKTSSSSKVYSVPALLDEIKILNQTKPLKLKGKKK